MACRVHDEDLAINGLMNVNPGRVFVNLSARFGSP